VWLIYASQRRTNKYAVNSFEMTETSSAREALRSVGGTLINVLSILARVASPTAGSYSASKASALSLTQAVRAELRAQGTRVIGVLPGYVDTDMTERIPAPKIQPIEVVRATLDTLQGDQDEVYPGEAATQIAALLLQNPKAVERQFAQSVAAEIAR
jgi:short-subunit dehydrogenase